MALSTSASCILPGGGEFSFNIATDNVQVAQDMLKTLPALTVVVREVGKNVATLGAVYFGYKLLRPLIESVVKKCLGDERDDTEVRGIRPGSLHVLLHCSTDKRFLEVLADYESGRMNERLQEEFLQIGIKIEGLRVEIENMVEVNETKEAINKRYHVNKDLCEDVKNVVITSAKSDVKKHVQSSRTEKKLPSTSSFETDFDSTSHSTWPQEESVTAIMKPLSRDEKVLFEEAHSLGLIGPNPDLQKPRAKLIDCINNSRNIGRSINHVSILLVGESGVGKTATINHLLGTKDEIGFEKKERKHFTSQTRSTQEFIIYGSEPRNEVEELPLGVVDTPGLSDTDGFCQDACNFFSIQKFFRTHPKLKGHYPNLIFLVVSANDTRIKGEKSKLAKSLRCVKKLDLVDPCNPNVVAILTHVCGMAYMNANKWSQKLETKKSDVRKIIYRTLEVTAPVVLLENLYGEDDHDLEVCGDYTRLPNGVLQPKNLYDACAGVLKENKDHLGLITLNSIFEASTKVAPKLGHKIEAKNAKSRELDVEERAFVDVLESTTRGEKINMSLTGILLDVSGSMRDNIESGTDEQRGPRARSIFKVIDDFIKHDVSSEDRIFAIGVGGNCARKIFDVIGGVQQIEDMKMPSYRKNMPATEDHIDEVLDILEKNGARNIRKWAKDIPLIQDIVSDHMAALILKRLKSDEQFLEKFVDEFLPSGCRDRFKLSRQTTSHRPHSMQTNPTETDPWQIGSSMQTAPLQIVNPRQTGPLQIVDPSQTGPLQIVKASQTGPLQIFSPSQTDPLQIFRPSQTDPLQILRLTQTDPRTYRINFPHFASAVVTATKMAATVAGAVVEDTGVGIASRVRPATSEDIQELVEKAKCDFLRDVETHSIFSVQDASRIIRGCVGEKELNELSTKRKQELLENIEPFIYGKTPLYESLEKATKLFEAEFEGATCKDKLLFVLSDGKPTDGSNEDIDKINQITSKLKKVGVKIVSCFISRSTDIHPKRLYDEMQLSWEPGAKFLFSLSSEVPTQHLPRAILVKRGWTIDIANNETKLFMQVNHPDNLREACEMARDVVCCPDALSELLVSVDLDIYINQATGGFKAKEQQGGTCYANASAAVLHLAMQRILGREGGYPDFHKLRDEMIEAYGIDGAKISEVLQEVCPNYRLHNQKVCSKGAMEAVVKKRPMVARFRLTDDEWKAFSKFYKKYPMGILTQNELDVRKRPTSPPPRTSGHAVVLTSYNSKCLTFMNSWGEEWADNGFFRVQNAKVLQLEFFDVYWTLNDLTEGEKEYYHKHGSEVAAKLMKSLKGLQKAEYTCPECEQTSLVTEFKGTLSKVRCPKCLCEFSTNDNAGNILALNMYLISLSR